MALDFPSSPVEGDLYSGYKFTNGIWVKTSILNGLRVVHRPFSVGSSTWTFDVDALWWDIWMCGGGGAGGGAAATAAAQAAAGAGGNPGGHYAASINRSNFAATTSVTVTVGTGGVAVAGANGGNGVASSITVLSVSANGGVGGIFGPAVTPPSFTPNTASVSGGSGARGGYSLRGQPGVIFSATASRGGDGGFGARFGAGMGGNGSNAGGNAQATSGAGGGGASNLASQAARAGGDGATGYVHIYEYCRL